MRTKSRQNEIPTERKPIRTNVQQNIARYCDSSVKGSSTANESLFTWRKAQQCKPNIR